MMNHETNRKKKLPPSAVAGRNARSPFVRKMLD
jgi:hypothetical protein